MSVSDQPVDSWFAISYGHGMNNVDAVRWVRDESGEYTVDDLCLEGYRVPTVAEQNDYWNAELDGYT